jgi:2,4-dienoyl-CoA reductase-like NADH-dependent reductase (Old Yellow Enzyme family)
VGKFDNLLSPLKIGPITLKNRFSMAPMNEVMAGVGGSATEESLNYFAARAKGGFGLVLTGAVMGTKQAARFVWGRNHYLFNLEHVQGLHQMTERVHHFGAQAGVQMTIGFGRQGHSDNHHELAPAATGGLPYEICADKMLNGMEAAGRKQERGREFFRGQNTYEMSIDEIHREQKEFARSIQLAGLAGFDYIDIHGPHGYLEHQFLSPRSNKRTDMYGGTWKNRKRMLVEVCEQTRYAAGPGMAVGCRISGEEHFEGGITREEMIDLAQDLERAGLDLIDLSDGGGYEECGHLIIDPDRWEHWPDTAADFKKALKIPVMMSGAHDPVLAESIVAQGKADLIGLGRQSICDPNLPNKVAAGKLDEIVKCKRCNVCLMRSLAGSGVKCPQNPMVGREWALDELKIGPMGPHEPLMPRALVAGMPTLELRPWWKKEIDICDKFEHAFRGPGPR